MELAVRNSRLPVQDVKQSNLVKHKQDGIADTEEKFKHKHVAHIKAASLDEASIAAKIRELQRWEDHVISHEKMHMMTGGSFVSAASYTYSYGPDGKKYISGGEVSFKLPVGASMESGLNALRKLKAAASAPGDPSGADQSAAAMASAIEISVINQMRIKQAKEAYDRERINEHTEKSKADEFISPISKMKFREVRAFQLFV